MELLGRMLGVENAVEIGRIEPSLAASWALSDAWWVATGRATLTRD